MFYAGDERYEPELSVAMNTTGPSDSAEFMFYAHVRCWKYKPEQGDNNQGPQQVRAN
jgi:hypothetical protein